MSRTLKMQQSASEADYEPHYDLNQKERNYPSIKNYYQASCKEQDKPVTYQPGLSNYSNLNLGDDRIMFKESLMDATFKREKRELTLKQTRHRSKPQHVLLREYVDAVRAVGFDEVERMERIIRDKLKQRSMATSSPFQVRKSFKFFDRENREALDVYGFMNAMEFLGFQFTELQVFAIFARYDKELTGMIDYMYLYQRCMEKDDDKPVVWPNTDHLGVKFEQNVPVEPPKKENIEAYNFDDDEIRILQQAELKRIFGMVDKQDTGYIPTGDLEIVLMALRMNLLPAEMISVQNVLDSEKTGNISFGEFFNWWYKAKA